MAICGARRLGEVGDILSVDADLAGIQIMERWISLMNVVLQEPECPTRPTRSPAADIDRESLVKGARWAP